MHRIEKQEGFRGQIRFVIPRPVLAKAAQHILVSDLYPTDIGMYPAAAHHYKERETGAGENILIICTHGQGWCEIGGRRRNVHRYQAVLLPKGQPHRYGASARSPWTIQWVHFAGENAPYYLTLLRQGEFLFPVQPELFPKIDRLFAEAFEALWDGFSQQNIICTAQIVQHILGLLFFSNKAFSPYAGTIRYRNLDGVIQFMKDHVDSTVTIGQMAQQAGLSAPHFSRLFTRQAGFSPLEYFIHLKIQRACRFLTLTTLSVKEISSRLGYSDQYYFSRIFHKVMGLSPMAYRWTQAA